MASSLRDDSAIREHASGTTTPDGLQPRHERQHHHHRRLSRDVSQADLEEAGVWANTVNSHDPWEPCILAFDGGGIRGYSSLLILQRLFHNIYEIEQDMERNDPIGIPIPNKEEDILPCEYFDFMYGTSTGGLISVMLARLRMSIGECMAQYRDVGEQLFGRKRSNIPLVVKYNHEPLEKVVKDIVAKRKLGSLHPWLATIERRGKNYVGVEDRTCLEADISGPPVDKTKDNALNGHDERRDSKATDDPIPDLPTVGTNHCTTANGPESPFGTESTSSYIDRWNPDDPRVCQSCCLTATAGDIDGQAHLLRSYPLYYDNSRPADVNIYNEGAVPLQIWQVTRATSAAPFYFKMLQAHIRDGDMSTDVGYKDGGIRENNPSEVAYNEYRTLYGHRYRIVGERTPPALLLSIGTGRADTKQAGFLTDWPWPFSVSPFLRSLIAGLEKFWIIPAVFIKFTESERAHRNMRTQAGGETTWYKRLNVTHGLENMALDDWISGDYHGEHDVKGGNTLERMEKATEAYLERERDETYESYAAPKDMISDVAVKLVKTRRARFKPGDPRWEVYIGKGSEGQGLEEEMRARQPF